jgi:hypothetical protein
MNSEKLIFIFVVVCLLNIFLNSVAFYLLRTRHPEVWNEMGERNVSLGNYLLFRRYRRLGDTRLILLFDVLNGVGVLSAILIAYLCLALFF